MPRADEIVLQLKAENKQLKGKLKESGKSVNKFSKGVGKMSKSFKTLLTGAGIFAVIAGISKLISITDKQAKAEAQLNAVLKSTKNAAGLTAGEIKKMARELQKVTTFGDETIISAQNMLLTFTKIGKDVFPAATETVLNMAEAMGTDLKTQAIQVGKALNDPILGVTALRRVGVQLSAQQEKSIKSFVAVNDIAGAQKIILGELETQFGGVARSAATTLGGSFQKLGNTIGDLFEDIGNDLSPELTRLSDAMFNASQDGGVLQKAVKKVGIVMKTATSLAANFINTLNRFFDEKLKARIESGEERLLAIVKANELHVEKLKKQLEVTKQLGDEESKIAAQEKELIAAKKQLAEFEFDLINAKLITANMLPKETKKIEENTEALNKNKRARKRVTTTVKGKGADPRIKEIQLLKFLGETELAEQKQLELQQENLLKAHKGREQEIREAADLKRRQIETKFLEFQVQNGLKILGATGNMLSQIGQLLSMSSQNNIANLDAEQQARREEIENTITDQTERDEALAALDEEFQRRKLKEQRKAAKIQKKIAIAETLIAIPQAAFNAFTALSKIPFVGPALGIAAAVAATALGFKKVQLIKDQPLPSFQEGRVPGNVPSNHFPAMIGSDEAVINGRSTRNNAELLDMINRNPEVTFSPIITAPDRPIQNIINIGGRTFFDEISRGIDDGQIRVNSRGVVGG